MRAFRFALPISSLVALLPVAAHATEATTTRIETRPFYGATVTLEAGVRVFRPLPPHSKVIINPNGRTPLNLGFEENRFVSHNYNYNYGGGTAAPVYDGGYGVGFADGHRGRRHHPHRHGAPFGPVGGKH